MDFSSRELRLIGEAQRSARHFRRGILADREIGISLIFDLACSDVDRVIPYVLAALPEEVRPAIERVADRMAASGFRDVPTGIVGPGPSPEEWAAIRARYPRVVEAIRASYRAMDAQPGLRETLAWLEIDLFWVALKEIGPAEGEICRSEGCDRPRVRVSAFCDRHHYERIAKKPAPAY